MTVETGHKVKLSEGATAPVVKPSRWPAAVRCTSIRRDGGRCRRWSIRGGHNCPKRSTPPSRARAARIMEDERARLVGLLPRARAVLAENMDHPDPDVRHRAAVQVQRMAPVAGKAGAHLDVAVKLDPALVIRKRLDQLRGAHETGLPSLEGPTSTQTLAQDDAEVVDAELVHGGGS